MSHDELAAEREQIDAIDEEVTRLLNRRVECALRVGEIKKGMDVPLHDPAREREVLDKLRQRNARIAGPLADGALIAIYREVMSACLNAEHPTTVAFLGPAGTNTQEAAVQYFGSAFIGLPCATPDEVCSAVERGAPGGGADYGVVAIENSIHGIVSPTLDLLANTNLTILAEVELLIHHCLLSNSDIAQISKVYSHEQGLGQCRAWLAAHMPGATLVPVNSTARGAEMAAKEEHAGAISTALAAGIYELRIVARNIEDLSGNKTRFFVVAPVLEAPRASGRDKTSLAFQVPHKPGALVEVLGVFKRHGINLSMIQSRPSRQQAWEYRFFADLQAHISDPRLQAALKELQEHTVSVKVMGSYPEAAG